MLGRIATTACLALALTLIGAQSFAASGDALIDYNLGLAARESGDSEAAYKRFKKACLAEEGLAEACLAWAELAAEKENPKDIKRALGSAVMLDPANITARYELAMMLIAKQDWVWAAEHLAEAVTHTENDQDRALLRYYLGYVKFKDGALDEAAKQLALAHRDLPADLAQKASYYRALIARDQDKHKKATSMFERAAEGPDEEIAAAAKAQLTAGTAFPRPEWFAGQVSASFGLSTHPSAAFLDDPGAVGETNPALQSVFRGDVVFSTPAYAHGFYGMFTAYREQNWTEIGDGGEQASEFDVGDMNITLFILQLAYVHRTRSSGLEHEIRVGVDYETQFFDHMPVKQDDGTYVPEEDPFGLNTFAAAEKLWWSMAPSRDSIWSIRFKIEERANYLDRNQSAVRLRLRLHNTSYFLGRTLQLKTMAGGRYYRTYHDPKVIKYDRLIPEGSLDLRWTSPWPRLAVLVGGMLRYNWYLNSKLNEENSFRPAYLDNPQFSQEQNEQFEADYYDLTRHDFEWELTAELQFKVWPRGVIALRYLHHQRLSNLDDAPVPVANLTGVYERVPHSEFGYTQDLVLLEVKQGF
jgi:tetratricopeptide (TPR) repeat protein